VIALRSLNNLADKLAKPEDPPVHSGSFARWLGQAAVIGVPLIFLILWAALLRAQHQS
jgi:hypothetical protein